MTSVKPFKQENKQSIFLEKLEMRTYEPHQQKTTTEQHACFRYKKLKMFGVNYGNIIYQKQHGYQTNI